MCEGAQDEILLLLAMEHGRAVAGAPVPSPKGLPLSALLCRHRVGCKKPISFAFICLMACLATAITMLSGCLVIGASEVLTIRFWVGERWLILWPLGFTLAASVTSGVAAYYIFSLGSTRLFNSSSPRTKPRLTRIFRIPPICLSNRIFTGLRSG